MAASGSLDDRRINFWQNVGDHKVSVKSSDWPFEVKGKKLENFRQNICLYVDGNVYTVEACENENKIVLKYLLHFKICLK